MSATNPPVNRLLFTYPLPEGSRVDGFGAHEIQTVMAVCTPDEEDGYFVSYTLVSETLGVLPYDGFDESRLPCAADICIEQLEIAIRALIETNLRSHEFGTLERSYSRAVLEYNLLAGQGDIRLHVECYWPRHGIYFVVMRLMRGKTDLGTIGARQFRGAGLNLDELCTRLQHMVEALLPDNFDALAAKLVHKHEIDGGDSHAG